jgi:hexosaminidase
MREHPRNRLWRIFALFLGALILVSCGKPAPTATSPNTTKKTTAIPTTVTPQIPSTSMDNIIPKPVSVVAAGETFSLSVHTGIYVEPGTDEVMNIGRYLADRLNPSTGYGIQVQATTGVPGKGNISLTLSGADPALGDEGYELTITPDLVKVSANQPAGLFYGIQTLRQLLPAAIDSSSVQPGPWRIGTGTIRDYPRFAWRGTMLDVARHFFSVRDVTRYIDLLAYYKINHFHLHLTNDQGWRIQINSWPNLALHGGSLEVDGTPGGYYSQDDYAYIVAYAQNRYITIVPEVDMPGHTNAALSSYAELNCDGIAPDLYTGTEVGFSSLCTSNDITYTFVGDVIAELAALTPGPYIHIGGDEANATDLADYLSFIERVQTIIKDNGKQMIGWEEIAQTRLLPTSVAQHWNPGEGLASLALEQGMKIIMSPADKAYMDMKYTPSTVLGLDWAGDITVQTAYSWDPASLIYDVPENNILGVEAPLWSETLNTIDDIEFMAFPRILGYAEIGWTPQAQRNWYEYKLRLAAQGPRLEVLGINFYQSPEIFWP